MSGSKAKRAARKADDEAVAFGTHGASRLPSVIVDTYNAEIRDDEGFLGDRASGTAFRKLVAEWRETMERNGIDPIDRESAKSRRKGKDKVGKSELDRLLSEGGLEAAGLVMSAIEDFAQALAAVILRYLKLKDWQGTERIVVGGGLRDSRIGEIAVGRAAAILAEASAGVSLHVIRHHPDEAGLIGAAHLAPAWMLAGHDAILAVDIGGSNIRCGIVTLDLKGAKDLSRASVARSELWRHRDDKPSRTGAVERLSQMLQDLVKKADKDGLRLAPFVGVGCPGIIEADGSIRRGAQNLPGDWESEHFNLPRILARDLPEIDGHEPLVVLHNDAVVQGLSALPDMTDVSRWGVLTIGTGLGNARFTNRAGRGEGGASD